MDFRWSDEQKALRDLARDILEDLATHDRLVELEAAGPTVFDRELWRALAEAGILGVVVPEAHGGSGLALLELLLVLEEAGRHVAPVPLVPTLVTGALPLARFGDEAVRAAWLPRIVRGDALVTAAVESLDAVDAVAPSVRATRDGDGAWRLSGERPFVPYAAEADLLLVPATTDDGAGVFLVEPGDGVTVTPLVSTNRAPLGHLDLDGAPATALVTPGPEGAAAVTWIVERGAARPRGARGRRQLPAAPLLPVGQAGRAHARHPDPGPDPAGRPAGGRARLRRHARVLGATGRSGARPADDVGGTPCSTNWRTCSRASWTRSPTARPWSVTRSG